MYHFHCRSIISQQRLLTLQATRAASRNTGSRRISTKAATDGQQIRKSSFRAEQQWVKQEGAASIEIPSKNIFSRISAWYSKKLESHPLTTKCITGGLIAGSGDVLCQYLTFDPSKYKQQEDGSEPSFWTVAYKPVRSFNFFIMGSCFCAPLNHIWFNYLSRAYPGTSVTAASKRVALDQFIWTPFWTVWWMVLFWTLEGTKPEDIPQGLKETYPRVMTSNYILWIPAQFFNFYVIPLKYQVLFTNGIELVWNTYLSFVNGGEKNMNEVAPEKDISTADDKVESEQQLQRNETQNLLRRRTFR